MNDYTEKIERKMERLSLAETHQRQMQTESFASNLNHELLTPIETIMYFLHTVILFLKSLTGLLPGTDELKQAQNYAQMIRCQLASLRSHVQGLLDLRMLQDGVFEFEEAVFNPNETIRTVIDVCRPQASS